MGNVINIVIWNDFRMLFFFFILRYERLLRRAKTEDLSEVSGIGCLYQCGVDRFGRPVVIFVGKWFKFKEINLDKVRSLDLIIILGEYWIIKLGGLDDTAKLIKMLAVVTS